ncbi:28431_t:CDS:2, partial [Racocetra persica]
ELFVTKSKAIITKEFKSPPKKIQNETPSTNRMTNKLKKKLKMQYFMRKLQHSTPFSVEFRSKTRHKNSLPSMPKKPLRSNSLPNAAYVQNHEESIEKQDTFWIPMLPNDAYAQNHEEPIINQDAFWVPILPNDVYVQNNEYIERQINGSLYASTSEYMLFCRDANTNHITDDWMYWPCCSFKRTFQI